MVSQLVALEFDPGHLIAAIAAQEPEDEALWNNLNIPGSLEILLLSNGVFQ